VVGARQCETVEAFIDIGGIGGPPYPPIFYRCYWQSTQQQNDILQHEWSATSKFIEWYDTNIIGGGNDVAQIITNLGGTPPGSQKLVPLLKVTNHSTQFP
jgi:hypothetical protein